MKRPGILALASILTNLILLGSLVHVYQTTTDVYLKAWIDQNILSTFTLILAGSLVAGSFFGYFLLRRKGPGLNIGKRLQRAGPLRQPSPLSRPNGLSVPGKTVPVGPPPGPTSKHTAYAVPPLSKPPAQTPQSQTPPSWSAAPKQWSPAAFRAQRQEQVERPAPQEPSYPIPQPSQPTIVQGPERTSSDEAPRSPATRPTPGFPSIPPRPSPSAEQTPLGDTPATYWKAPPEMAKERRQAPFTTTPPNQSTPPSIPPYSRPAPGPGLDRPSGFTPPPQQPPYRQPIDPTAQQYRWTDPVPRTEYGNPQKWLPPSASPVSRPPAPTSPGFRPNPTGDNRPGPAGPQETRRPLGYSMPIRPSAGGEAPRFRPPERPPPGTDVSQSPFSPGPRLPPIQRQSPADARPGTQTPLPDQTSSQPPSTGPRTSQSEDTRPPSPPIPSTGDMDWDTALDAILKTLRKDKIEDKT